MLPKNDTSINLSLKETCLAAVETMILSGELGVGEKLLPERDFAAKLGVSRPVLHEALVELSLKGLVTISPRHGVIVNDFRKNGSMLLLDSLLTYQHFKLSENVWQNMFDFRRLIEGETAWLAAQKRTKEQLSKLNAILDEEDKIDCSSPEKLTELDFSYHLEIAQISGNIIYPLLINSFKEAYTSYTHAFFKNNICSPIIAEVFRYHSQLVHAITESKPDLAKEIMIAMLGHGQKYWKG